MKKIVFGIIAVLAIAGCQEKQLGSDPVTLALQVTNKGDQSFKCMQTFAVDRTNVWTAVGVGQTVNLQSNTHSPSGSVLTCYITPPTSVKDPNPGNGNFEMSYGYWSGSAHVTCDNDCNKGNPTSSIHYTGNNWKYTAKFAKSQSEPYNSVEITTGPKDWTDE